MIKKILFGIVVLTHAYGMSQMSFGEAETINENWSFSLQGDNVFYEEPPKDSNWQVVGLPHDWSVKGKLDPKLASATGYLPGGMAWYKKSITVPPNKKGQKVFFYFEGVYNRSEVFINGKSLGKRPNGYISFAYDATNYINFGEENVITVRVDHRQSADSRWYTGSGIYRDVWLVYANPVHITQWGVYAYPELKGNSGVLNIEAEVQNESGAQANLEVVSELFSSEGFMVAKTSNALKLQASRTGKIETALVVETPKLWDIENPNLYQLKTTVLKNGEIIDQTTTQTGFRKFTFDPNKGFALNNKWMKMKGVCLHHDGGVLGSAVPREVWKSRLMTLKEIGVNAIRTSHNPQAPDLYELCDELGLLVLNEAYDEWEFPKRKWLEGWNVGTPGYEGSYDIFADWAERDLEDFVRRDRNHISVFAWSIGNEVDYPNDPYSHPVLDGGADTGFSQAIYGGYKKDAPDAMRLGAIAKRLVATVKKFDKSRPVTAGLAGVAMSNETEYPEALDIAGYNYTESKYQSDHEKYPNRVIFGSENRHDLNAWKAVVENEHIFGQFLWTGIDYLGESGKWPSRGFYSGLVDFKGDIKPRGYFRQSLWSENPMIYIGTYPIRDPENKNLSIDAWPFWNYKDKQNIRVVCYTNAAKAQLELNGTVVGEVKPYDKDTGIISWDIPFEPGKLEAVGFNEKNEEVSRFTIETPKLAVALEVGRNKDIDKSSSVQQLTVSVVDENGVLVKSSEHEVVCSITGPGELLGLEAANNSDMGDYTDNKHNVFHGEISAYIKRKGKGAITVKFTNPELKPTEITLK